MALHTPTPRITSLAQLVRSRALARLLIHFSLHPDGGLHFRALGRHSGLGIASLQAELARLEVLGLLRRERRGRHTVFHARSNSGGWRAVRHLIRVFADPVEVLADALAGIPGIQAAFAFGSFARGDSAPESDVDVFVLSEGIDPARVGTAALEASVLLEREVHIVRFTSEGLGDRLKQRSAFLKTILSGPQRWIVGDERSLRTAV